MARVIYPAIRSPRLELSASTSRILAPGAAACAHSTSSAISPATRRRSPGAPRSRSGPPPTGTRRRAPPGRSARVEGCQVGRDVGVVVRAHDGDRLPRTATGDGAGLRRERHMVQPVRGSDLRGRVTGRVGELAPRPQSRKKKSPKWKRVNNRFGEAVMPPAEKSCLRSRPSISLPIERLLPPRRRGHRFEPDRAACDGDVGKGPCALWTSSGTSDDPFGPTWSRGAARFFPHFAPDPDSNAAENPVRRSAHTAPWLVPAASPSAARPRALRPDCSGEFAPAVAGQYGATTTKHCESLRSTRP